MKFFHIYVDREYYPCGCTYVVNVETGEASLAFPCAWHKANQEILKISSSGNMPTYITYWKGSIYGTSVVDADSIDEARRLVEAGNDRDWDIGDSTDWEITEVEELPKNDLEPLFGENDS